MESPRTLQQAIQYFSDEQICIDAVAEMRWPNGVVCELCGGDQPYYLKTQKRWKCRKCRKQFSVKVNSIFEDSPISLTKWLPALWLFSELQEWDFELRISSRSWRYSEVGMVHASAFIRLALKARDFSFKMGSGEGGAVEVDETFIGGKTKNMHYSRKVKIAQKHSELPKWKSTDRYPGKTAVMGIFDRESRQIRAKVVPNIKRETLQTEILNNIEHGSVSIAIKQSPTTN